MVAVLIVNTAGHPHRVHVQQDLSDLAAETEVRWPDSRTRPQRRHSTPSAASEPMSD